MSTAREDSPITMKTRKQKLLGTSVGALALLVSVGASLTACKDLGALAALPKDPLSTASALPPGPSTAPSAGTSASPSASPSPTKSTSSSATPKPPGAPPTYTVAGYPTAANTGYPHGLPGDTRKAV